MAETQAAIDYPVYLGVWTNWSLGGKITGSTITLTHRNGALLTAFLAIFITFAGSRLWRIVCFAIYQLLLSKSSKSGLSQDGLYHQCQAILRNTTDEKIGLLNLCRVLQAWRHRAHRPIIRILPIIGLSLLITALFALASVFSSRISSKMGNEVLLSSTDCGRDLINNTNTTATQDAMIYRPWSVERMTSYANYAQRCYSDSSYTDSEGRSSCNLYIKRNFSSTVDRNASCPFQEKICRHEYDNIKIDTGYLDSQADLGLNTPTDLRFKFRRVLQCAPLKSKGYQQPAFYSPDKPYVRYFYGLKKGPESNGTAQALSFTHEVEQQSAKELAWQRFSKSYAEYLIFTRGCYIYNGTCDDELSSFIPITELTQTDGDVTLIFLSANGVRYTQPVDDEWYAAHQTTTDFIANTRYAGQEPYYLSDEPASALGCKEQYQSCDPSLPPEQGCSPLEGINTVGFEFQTPKTKREMAVYWGLELIPIQTVIQQLQSSSLTSRFTLSQGVQAPLLTNQWQREVENWHNTLMAAFQGEAVDTAVGPGNPEILKYFWIRPSNDVERYLCKSQKIISTGYTNFSAMWLFIVLIIGTLTILLESVLETVVVWLERHNVIKVSSTEWFGNDIFQLQRMAHEELGLGNWEGCKGSEVPVTQKGQLLGVFSTENPEHPRLVNPNLDTQKPDGTTTAIDSSSQMAVADGSETEAYENEHRLSQDGNHNSVSHIGTSTGSSPTEHQENDQSSVGHDGIPDPDPSVERHDDSPPVNPVPDPAEIQAAAHAQSPERQTDRTTIPSI